MAETIPKMVSPAYLRFRSGAQVYKKQKRRMAELDVEMAMEDCSDRYSIAGVKKFEYELMKQSVTNVETVLNKAKNVHGSRCHEILWTHYIDGMTLEETADIFNMPYYTLKAWVRKWMSELVGE